MEQIDAIVGPSKESKDLVLEWLGEHGLADGVTFNARGNTIKVKATVSQAEELLATQYNSYCTYPAHFDFETRDADCYQPMLRPARRPHGHLASTSPECSWATSP